ncbi:MAG: carboxypeptidase-like regulatory domain-containing protein, partial [Bacteroidetes bacterium]|nr:carboxypeptidase-like regulatory domain-containing protein [Bacteroidota bacterium]
MILSILVLTLIAPRANAQGVTTAAISGVVTDDQGGPLPGANVIALHEPTGTTYGASTRLSGAYSLLNMKVGGPYTLTVSFIGFETRTESNVFLSLAQNLRLNYQMAVQALEVGA